MNAAKQSAGIEVKVRDRGITMCSQKDSMLSSPPAGGMRTTLLVERIGMFPSSGEIHCPTHAPCALLAHLKSLYAHQALDIDERDGLKVTFTHWRFRMRIPDSEPVVIMSVESRGDTTLMHLKTAELLSHLELFENEAPARKQ